jgi:hypothetical protein
VINVGLIDANVLKKEIESYLLPYREVNYQLANSLYTAVYTLIISAPTVDAEPVRHGNIIETIKDGKYHREFSCCGRDFTQLTMWYMPRFCPNCGAKMED